MHKFEIEDGVVKYSSKFLRSDCYLTNSKNNRIMISEFGTLAMPDPCKNIFERFMSKFDLSSKYHFWISLAHIPHLKLVLSIREMLRDTPSIFFFFVRSGERGEWENF